MSSVNALLNGVSSQLVSRQLTKTPASAPEVSCEINEWNDNMDTVSQTVGHPGVQSLMRRHDIHPAHPASGKSRGMSRYDVPGAAKFYTSIDFSDLMVTKFNPTALYALGIGSPGGISALGPIGSDSSSSSAQTPANGLGGSHITFNQRLLVVDDGRPSVTPGDGLCTGDSPIPPTPERNSSVSEISGHSTPAPTMKVYSPLVLMGRDPDCPKTFWAVSEAAAKDLEKSAMEFEKAVAQMAVLIRASIAPSDLAKLRTDKVFEHAYQHNRIDIMWERIQLEFGTTSGTVEEYAPLTFGTLDMMLAMCQRPLENRPIPNLIQDWKNMLLSMQKSGFEQENHEKLLAFAFVKLLFNDYGHHIGLAVQGKKFEYKDMNLEYVFKMASDWHNMTQRYGIMGYNPDQAIAQQVTVNAVASKPPTPSSAKPPYSNKKRDGASTSKEKNSSKKFKLSGKKHKEDRKSSRRPRADGDKYCTVHKHGDHSTDDCPDITPAGKAHAKVTEAEYAKRVSSPSNPKKIQKTTANVIQVKAFAMGALPGPKDPDIIEVGLDSMCSHSVTHIKELLHNIETDEVYQINSYNGSYDMVSECGTNPVLGKLIYDPRPGKTLLSKGGIRNLFDTHETSDQVVLVSKVDPSVKLVFKYTGEEAEFPNLLVCEISKSLLSRLVKVQVNSVQTTIPAGQMSEYLPVLDADAVISRNEYLRILTVGALHVVLCHAGLRSLRSFVEMRSLLDLPMCLRDVDNYWALAGRNCPACAVGKIVFQPLSSDAPRNAPRTRPLPMSGESALVVTAEKNTVAFDIATIQEDKFITLIHIRTRYIHCFHIDSRTASSIKEALTKALNDYSRYGQMAVGDEKVQLQQLVSDNEPGLVALDISSFLADRGIVLTTVSSGDHVGIIERQIRTIKDRVSAMAHSLPFQLTKKLLQCLVVHVCNTINLIPREGAIRSPFTMFTGVYPRYCEVIPVVFGQTICAYKKSLGSDAMGSGDLGLIVGFGNRTMGAIQVYSLKSNHITHRSRYSLVEKVDLSAYGFKSNPNYLAPLRVPRSLGTIASCASRGEDARKEDELREIGLKRSLEGNSGVSDAIDRDGDMLVGEIDPIKIPRFSDVEVQEEHVNPRDEPEPGTSKIPIQSVPYDSPDVPMFKLRDTGAATSATDAVKPLTRSQPPRGAKGSNWRTKYQVTVNAVSASKTIRWKQALDIHGEEAKVAIKKELTQLVHEYGAFVPVEKDLRIETYCRTLDLFDVKADNTLKARLVMSRTNKGHAADYGIDPYSPTLDLKVLSLMLSLAAYYDLNLEVWDVKGAFLKAPMIVDGVYVLLRRDIAALVLQLEPHWKTYLRGDGTMMVEVRKAWYGSASAPALWNKTLSTCLTGKGNYVMHPLVECLYYRNLGRGRDGKPIFSFIMVHVDDMGALMPKDGVERNRIHTILVEEFEALKVQKGNSVTYIGIEIRSRDNCFFLSMKDRIENLAKEYGMDLEVSVPAPVISAEGFLEHRPKSVSNSAVDATAFRSLIMTLRYVAMLVKPECAMLCSYLATYQVNPTANEWDKAIRILQYMISTRDSVIKISSIGSLTPVIAIYTDAAFGMHRTSHSHSGRAVFIGDCAGVISYSSNKQSVITKSSTDAELIAVSDSDYVGEMYAEILKIFGIMAEVRYHCDNLSTVHMCMNGVHSAKNKRRHILIRINALHEMVVARELKIYHVGTNDNVSDILTKPLVGPKFTRFTNWLCGVTSKSGVVCR